MSKQPTISINLLRVIRITAIVLLICFFLPWTSGTFGAFSGLSVVVELVSNFAYYMSLTPLPIIFIAGWGFIPIGAVVTLLLSYFYPHRLPRLSVLTGVLGMVPVFLTMLTAPKLSQLYLPMLLTIFCLVILVVTGAILYWKSANETPASAF